jgi:hypothetical protein
MESFLKCILYMDIEVCNSSCMSIVGWIFLITLWIGWMDMRNMENAKHGCGREFNAVVG